MNLKDLLNSNKLSLGTEIKLDKTNKYAQLTNGQSVSLTNLRNAIQNNIITVDETTGDITVAAGCRSFESNGTLFFTNKEQTNVGPTW